jgi:AcrR family transcriptional regulator
MSPRVSAHNREQYLHERRDRILDAAVDVFGREGFAGANVAEIASAAGIAKGTVYLYFTSKEEIFSTILVERSFIPQLSNLMVENQPLETTLRNIAESYYCFMDANLTIFRIAIADSYYFPDHARQVYREIVLKGNQALADFLDRLAKAGLIRPLEAPFLTARVFIGLLSTYILSQEILGGKDITPVERKAWIEEIIQVFLEGVNPDYS